MHACLRCSGRKQNLVALLRREIGFINVHAIDYRAKTIACLIRQSLVNILSQIQRL